MYGEEERGGVGASVAWKMMGEAWVSNCVGGASVVMSYHAAEMRAEMKRRGFRINTWIKILMKRWMSRGKAFGFGYRGFLLLDLYWPPHLSVLAALCLSLSFGFDFTWSRCWNDDTLRCVHLGPLLN
jgi:hypothetical protein